MFYTLSDKTWVFDQSERAQCPIYILKGNKMIKPKLKEHWLSTCNRNV